MHRNTYLLVVFLAVFAALVVGVNIGKRMTTPVQTQETVSPTPTNADAVFQYSGCGIALQYPSTLTLMDSASGSALLVDKENTDQSVAVTCQKDIPRPNLTADSIETLAIGSASAKLYHDSSSKDGTKIDELIFKHPDTGLDVFIAGFGQSFDAIIATVRLLP